MGLTKNILESVFLVFNACLRIIEVPNAREIRSSASFYSGLIADILLRMIVLTFWTKLTQKVTLASALDIQPFSVIMFPKYETIFRCSSIWFFFPIFTFHFPIGESGIIKEYLFACVIYPIPLSFTVFIGTPNQYPFSSARKKFLELDSKLLKII